ncbi:MAG: DUF3943 domain-containing protein, partial [Caldimonas sp.]
MIPAPWLELSRSPASMRRCRRTFGRAIPLALVATLAGGATLGWAQSTPTAADPASAAASSPEALAPPRALRPRADEPATPPDYRLPAIEIVGFQFLVNRANRYFGTGREDYRVTGTTIRDNLKSSWATDRDPFKINQLGHPYQGAMYHGFARSTGH